LNRTARDISERVRSGSLAAVDVVRQSLEVIHHLNPKINAFVEVFEQQAIARAMSIDALIKAGKAANLKFAGVPVAVKDNICIGPDLDRVGDGNGFGGRTTCCSAILREYKSPYTATAAQRLIDAGAIVIGKTNMDEFGMGSSTERSIFGPTRNPHAVEYVSGGSSGGSAAAVASGMVPIALGSDTGGSVRQPAAWCGVVGVKPTYGRVSRYGLVAYASSLDQIGVIGTNGEDVFDCLRVISGGDEHDATSMREEMKDFNTSRVIRSIAVPRRALSDANHPEVNALFNAWIQRCSSRGVVVNEVEMSTIDAAIAAYYIIAPAEASSNLARYDGVRYGTRSNTGGDLEALYTNSRGEGFGPEVKRRIMLGTYVLSAGYQDAFYKKAQSTRRAVAREFAHVLETHDVIATPTTPSHAFKVGEKLDDPLAMYMEDAYTVPVNLAGLPAMSLPMGSVMSGAAALPVGVQLIAKANDEEALELLANTQFGN
jgi:aspartyl-tRNA(Asn)/glutamyl-tRNA(Gln) amidotransferase subunit A